MESSQKNVAEELEEGKQRDEIFDSFRVIGVVLVSLGFIMVFLNIAIFIVVINFRAGPSGFSLVGDGFWCGVFVIAAGVTTFVTSYNLTYCTAGWTLICSVLGSIFMVICLFFELAAAVMMFQPRSSDVWYSISVMHSFQSAFGAASLSLCLYNSVTFSKLMISYPYKRTSLCPCFFPPPGERQPLGYVMYSNINPKKHNS